MGKAIGKLFSRNKVPEPSEPKKSIKNDEEDRRDDGGELFLERKFAEEFLRNQKIHERESVDSRLRYNNEKLEYLEQKLNEIVESRLLDQNEMATAINWLINNRFGADQRKQEDDAERIVIAKPINSNNNLPLMKKASTKKSK